MLTYTPRTLSPRIRDGPLSPTAPRHPEKNLHIFGDPKDPWVSPVFPNIPQICQYNFEPLSIFPNLLLISQVIGKSTLFKISHLAFIQGIIGYPAFRRPKAYSCRYAPQSVCCPEWDYPILPQITMDWRALTRFAPDWHILSYKAAGCPMWPQITKDRPELPQFSPGCPGSFQSFPGRPCKNLLVFRGWEEGVYVWTYECVSHLL